MNAPLTDEQRRSFRESLERAEAKLLEETMKAAEKYGFDKENRRIPFLREETSSRLIQFLATNCVNVLQSLGISNDELNGRCFEIPQPTVREIGEIERIQSRRPHPVSSATGDFIDVDAVPNSSAELPFK